MALKLHIQRQASGISGNNPEGLWMTPYGRGSGAFTSFPLFAIWRHDYCTDTSKVDGGGKKHNKIWTIQVDSDRTIVVDKNWLKADLWYSLKNGTRQRFQIKISGTLFEAGRNEYVTVWKRQIGEIVLVREVGPYRLQDSWQPEFTKLFLSQRTEVEVDCHPSHWWNKIRNNKWRFKPVFLHNCSSIIFCDKLILFFFIWSRQQICLVTFFWKASHAIINKEVDAVDYIFIEVDCSASSRNMDWCRYLNSLCLKPLQIVRCPVFSVERGKEAIFIVE